MYRFIHWIMDNYPKIFLIILITGSASHVIIAPALALLRVMGYIYIPVWVIYLPILFYDAAVAILLTSIVALALIIDW